MRANPYSMESLLTVARAVSQRGNIVVNIGNNATASCSYNPNTRQFTIDMPVMQETERGFYLARGYIDHECGHALYTDFSARSQCPDNIVRQLTNTFEDARIERKIGQVYPGCKQNIQKLNEIIFSESGKGLAKSKAFFVDDVYNWVLVASLLPENPVLQELNNNYVTAIEKNLPGLLQLLTPHIDTVASLNSTADAIRLAETVYNVIRQYCQQNGQNNQQNGQNSQQSGNSLQNQSGQQSEQNEQNTENAHNDGQNGQNSQNNGQQGENGENDSQNVQSGNDKQASNGNGNTSDTKQNNTQNNSQFSQNISELYNSTTNNASFITDIKSLAMDIETYHNRNDAECDCIAENMGQYRAIGALEAQEIQQSHSCINSLSARLTSLLQTTTRARYSNSYRGRINNRALSTVNTNSRLFQTRSDGRAINTEIILLCDISGSMRDYGRIDILQQSIYATMKTLRRFSHIRSSCFLFNENFYTLFSHNSPITRNCKIFPASCTYMGNAMLKSIQRFSPHYNRHILIVMTDGDAHDNETCQHVFNIAPRLGIEIYGIGMQSDTLDSYNNCQHENITDMRQLAPALIKVLTSKLAA